MIIVKYKATPHSEWRVWDGMKNMFTVEELRVLCKKTFDAKKQTVEIGGQRIHAFMTSQGNSWDTLNGWTLGDAHDS